MAEYTIDENELMEAKKSNDWLKILRMYGHEQMDSPVDTSLLTADDCRELFFAAQHWTDALLKQAETTMRNHSVSSNDKKYVAERALRAMFWTIDGLKQVNENFKTPITEKNLAYSLYQLKFASHVIGKISKNCRVSADISKKCAHLISTDFEEGYKLLTSVIQKNPEDYKNTYRLAKFISKEKKESGYKIIRESKKAIYQKWFSEIIEYYARVEKAYEEYNPPKIDRKTYIKAKYGLAVEFNDDFLKGFSVNYCIKQIRAHEKINVKSKDSTLFCQGTGLKLNLSMLKRADDAIKTVKAELGYSEMPTSEDLEKMAKEPNPIEQSYFIYYRQAKIYYVMMLVYGSSFYPIYKLRKTEVGAKRVCEKYDRYYELAVQNAEYALELRLKRKSLGMTDAGGAASHEPELLAQLFSLARNDNSATIKLEEIKKRFPKNNDVEYYYIITKYFLNPSSDAKKKTIAALKKYKESLKMFTLKQRAEKMIELLEQGKL